MGVGPGVQIPALLIETIFSVEIIELFLFPFSIKILILPCKSLLKIHEFCHFFVQESKF